MERPGPPFRDQRVELETARYSTSANRRQKRIRGLCAGIVRLPRCRPPYLPSIWTAISDIKTREEYEFTEPIPRCQGIAHGCPSWSVQDGNEGTCIL